MKSNTYFDESFSPHMKISLRNTFKKQISQVLYSFVYNDYAGWGDSSMKRSLIEAATVHVIRNVNLPVGSIINDDFPIPKLDGFESKKPTGHISKIRYSDGSIESFD